MEDEDKEMLDYFRDFAASLVLMAIAIGIGFGFGKGPRLDVQKSGGPVSLDVAALRISRMLVLRCSM